MTLSNVSLPDQLHISLERVNRDLERIITYDQDLASRSIVATSVLDLIRAGGKRLRPLMVIVGSRFGDDPENRDVYKLAAVCEFIHAASLIHDDILDQADTRRGQPALHRKVGTKTAVYIGNYITCRVIELLTGQGTELENYIQDLTSVTTTQLCLGEYQQMEQRYNFNITLEQYWEKTRNKTALLMAASLQVGARAGMADLEVADALYEFGDYLGMAFQVRDDVLDYMQTADTLGKPAGADLRNGQVTLPAMIAKEDPYIRKHLITLTEESPIEAFDEAVGLIRDSGALAEALDMSHAFMQKAWNLSEELADYPAHRDLQTLWRYFEERTY
ncbi:polyprenyl synthetase family protein [Paenibacillus sp. 1001270B_150601_E10]|uniref:polyprenyl synthetase family protein n=1 Tax=Paenibacillus sp. 1001270B_150601_E10 TaxID=2787079 RepID=UPI00189D7F33|nr:polyprenyl synthetase family protein [Paenibacillus sp. 1001270B_150601_E10]